MSVCARLLLLWLPCVMAVTLAPFNFVAMSAGSRILDYSSYERDPADFVLNLVLFVPLGVLLNHEGRLRSLTPGSIVILAGTVAALISTTVECFQAFVPTRNSSLIDVLANTGGALLGVAADRAWGASVSAGLHGWRIRTSPATLAGLIASYLIVALMISGGLQTRSRLSNWSSEYPLLIGNELTGDRAWRGRVFSLWMADAAASPVTVQRFAAGEPIVMAGTPVAAFDFTGSPPFKDATGHLPDLEWSQPPTASATASSRPGSSWLQSDGPASGLADRLRRTNAFTLLVRCATEDTDQKGPARIISNSVSPSLRNFTLGQEGSDLVLRLRTPQTGVNGYPLEVAVPGMFSDREPREIMVTYDGAALVAAMAHRDRVFRTELTVGGSVASTIFSLNVRADELHVYQLVYVAALALVPGVVVGLLGQTSRDRQVIGVALVISLALLLEMILTRTSGRAFDWANVAVTAGVGAAVFATFAVALSQPDLPYRSQHTPGGRRRST